MNAQELQHLLRQRFPVEDERSEWKGWRNLRHNVSGRKGERLDGAWSSDEAGFDHGAAFRQSFGQAYRISPMETASC